MKEKQNIVMALVCDAFPPPRIDAIERLVKIRGPSLTNIHNFFVDYIPDSDEKKLILIVTKPKGQPLMPRGSNELPKIQIQDLKQNILLPVANALKVLHDHQISHRGVRPDNIFYHSFREDSVLLGECYSTPPGFLQPAFFETISCGMCAPEGRGAGTIGDDIYAFGVLAFLLATGSYPAYIDSSQDMTYAKLEKGSYAYFTKNQTGLEQISPLLIGTLADNEKERWNIDDILGWLDGKTVRLLIGSSDTARGSRAIMMNDRANYNCDELAYSMAHSWKEALEFLKSDALANWLRFSIVDPQKTEAIEELLNSSDTLHEENKFRKNTLLSRVIMALSGKMCIFWEKIALMPTGLDVFLAYNAMSNKPTETLESIINSRLPVHWIEAQKLLGNTPPRLHYNFDTLPRILDRKRIGYGIEAVLYMINVSLPCLSPLVRKYYVIHVDDLLAALEDIVKKSGDTTLINILDLHIVAFIVARTRILRDNDLRGLLVKDPLQLSLNRLKLLSRLQSKSESSTLPSLAGLLFRQVKSLLLDYRHLPTKKLLTAECQKAIQSGNLETLCKLVDNPTLKANDLINYARACSAFDHVENEIRFIIDNILNTHSPSRVNASKVYAIAISSFMSLVCLVGYFIYYFIYEVK